MRVLISGSIAYDSIMTFPGLFTDHIVPDQLHRLNVSFVTSNMRREFGGCATNIAYGLKALGATPLILGAAGHDFAPYRYRLDKLGIDDRHIGIFDDCFTAQAYITTDKANNQIASFHPGAMIKSAEVHVNDAKNIRFGVVAPNSLDAMIQHCQEFARADIPFLFDPGQGILHFSGHQLIDCLKLCEYVVLNHYEATLLMEKTELTVDQITRLVTALVITNSAEGSTIYTSDEIITIDSIKPDCIVDPTGCGDAYRAGLVYGILANWDWEKIGQLASLMGSIKIASRGAQNYLNKKDLIDQLFSKHCGQHLL